MQTNYFNTVLCFILLGFSLSSFAITQKGMFDSSDSIAFVAYHDNPNDFSFVLLDDVSNTSNGLMITCANEGWADTHFDLSHKGNVTWINNTGVLFVVSDVL